MDKRRKYLLHVHRFSIIQDLDVAWIIEDLIAQKAIDADQADFILNLTHRRDKVTTLLDMLPGNGNEAYDIFVDSMKKDYSWLADKLKITDIVEPSTHYEAESLDDCLGRGDVPRMPMYYVARRELEDALSADLRKLSRHQMLVLYGMAGCGKTSLAIRVMRNDPSLVFDSFKGNVFWINVGDCYNEEQIVLLQSKIYKNICTRDFFVDNGSSDAVSEISLNSSTTSSRTQYQKLTDYQSMLRSAFEDVNFRDSLLVIDDLRCEIVAQAFDVGCKVLVTTQDTSYISKFNPNKLNVSESLTEAQSLELIAGCVEQEVDKLPVYANKIHKLCKGAPLLMALIGGIMAENKERLAHNDYDYWKSYIKQLKNRDNFIYRMLKNTSSPQKPYLAIPMCIESLGDRMIISLFKSLAVLPDNVKISTKALCTIFRKPETEVEDIMKKLKNKSLVLEYFNVDLKCYQYEIHDIIMSYLKSIHNEEDMRRLHTSLIHSYKEVSLDKNLVNLPNDEYISNYIGYHIEQTKDMDNMWSMFNQLYTNLTFIGNKIRLAGPADVLHDFNKYSHHIIKRASDKDLITELNKFIVSHGYDLHWYPNTDIIQNIFQHTQKGLLYNKACSISLHPDNRNNLYFQFEYENSNEEANFTVLDVKDTICIVKFWMNCVLTGNANGKIILWSLVLNKKLRTFHGHQGPIRSICLDCKGSHYRMATIANDGLLKIWNIDYDECDSSEYDDLADDVPESDSTIEYNREQPFASSYWGHNHNILLTHTDPGGSLVIYSSAGVKLKEMKKMGDYSISSSVLSLDDSLAICGYVNNKSCTQKYGVHIYNTQNGDFVMSFTEKEFVLALAVVPDHPKSVLSLTKTHLNRHQWRHSVHISMSQACSVSQVNIADLEVLKAEYTFETGCVSEDGLYMFVSTTDGHILIYSLKNNEMVLEVNNHRGKVTSLDSLCHKSHLNHPPIYNLITKSGEDVHTLKIWLFQSSDFTLASENEGKAKLSSKFDCVFDKQFLNSPIGLNYHYGEYPSTPIRRVETMARTAPEAANNNTPKVAISKTLSLDRHSLRLLDLKNNISSDQLRHPIIAVVDRKNKVQILRGKKCVIETNPTKSTITTVALSRCGQYLTYGTKEGVVNLLYLKLRTSKKIMDLNDEVHYLEFINDKILVAASRSGGLMVYEILASEESIAKMLVKSVEFGSQELINDFSGKRNKNTEYWERSKQSSPPSSSSLMTNIECNGNNIHRTYPSTESHLYKQTIVIKCFWLEDFQLLSVACDGSVKRWNLDPSLRGIVIRKQSDFKVTCASLYKNVFLVLCNDMGKFQIHSLVLDSSNNLSGVLYDFNKVKSGITCCTISEDGKLLALGLESGMIALWHIATKAMVTALNLHKSKVRCLKFSPGPHLDIDSVQSPPHSPFLKKTFSFPPANLPQEEPVSEKPPLVLVSLAGQIVWWDITQVMKLKAQNRKKKLGTSFLLLSPKSNSMINFNTSSEAELANSVLKSATGDFDNNSVHQWENLWTGKRAKRNHVRKEILSCIKLVGEEASQVLIDDKFSKFVTVDQSGNLYIMNVMENTSPCHKFSNGNNQNS